MRPGIIFTFVMIAGFTLFLNFMAALCAVNHSALEPMAVFFRDVGNMLFFTGLFALPAWWLYRQLQMVNRPGMSQVKSASAQTAADIPSEDTIGAEHAGWVSLGTRGAAAHSMQSPPINAMSTSAESDWARPVYVQFAKSRRSNTIPLRPPRRGERM
jgi:hypothetical protein